MSRPVFPRVTRHRARQPRPCLRPCHHRHSGDRDRARCQGDARRHPRARRQRHGGDRGSQGSERSHPARAHLRGRRSRKLLACGRPHRACWSCRARAGSTTATTIRVPARAGSPMACCTCPRASRPGSLCGRQDAGAPARSWSTIAGSRICEAALDWALLTGLWTVERVVVVGVRGRHARAALEAIARPARGGDTVFDAEQGNADSVAAGGAGRCRRDHRWARRPYRRARAGTVTHWYDRLIAGFSGDILLVCR